MTSRSSVYSLRVSRALAGGLLIAALCALAGSGVAAVRAELFQATAPLTDRSESGHTAAFQDAMRTVLVRVTGRRGADQDPALAPLVNEARRYVQQYRPAADNQLLISFDGNAIERWLAQNAQPIWGRERPATFVWLTVPGGGLAGGVVGRDDASELKTAIDAEAAVRGIGLLWPTAAQLQGNRIDAAAVNNPAAAATLADVGRRLGGEGVLIGHAGGATATAPVRWVHLFQDRRSEFAGPLEGVDGAADAYAAVFATVGAPTPVDVEVGGIGDLRAYAKVQNYLESLAYVSHVGVQSVSGDRVTFRLTTRGGAGPMQRALSLGGPLEPVGAADNGMQRFRLRP